MEKQFNRNKRKLTVSYNNVEKKIILGFLNETESVGKFYDYYSLDANESSELLKYMMLVKGTFDNQVIDPLKTYEENYVAPERIKLPAGEEEPQIYVMEFDYAVISLPQTTIDSSVQELIVDACRKFMETLCYKLDRESAPNYDSFLQVLNFARTENFSAEVIRRQYAEAKKEFAGLLSSPSEQKTSDMNSAIVHLAHVLEQVEAAVLQLGELIIVKISRKGKTLNAVEILTTSLVERMNENPDLFKHPSALLEVINVEANSQREEEN